MRFLGHPSLANKQDQRGAVSNEYDLKRRLNIERSKADYKLVRESSASECAHHSDDFPDLMLGSAARR